jgi:alkylated DNA nucleotide flippase Atl1
MEKTCGKGTLVIPAPREVDAVMAKAKKGKLLNINAIRAVLAKQHKATTTCPICTGIFAWISANAAQEAIEAGAKRVTPYWRTLKGENEINPKYPGGLEVQKALLEAEGHKVITKGKRMLVEGADKKMMRSLA